MTSDDTAARELADRIDAATLGLFDIATIYIGDRLGFLWRPRYRRARRPRGRACLRDRDARAVHP